MESCLSAVLRDAPLSPGEVQFVRLCAQYLIESVVSFKPCSLLCTVAHWLLQTDISLRSRVPRQRGRVQWDELHSPMCLPPLRGASAPRCPSCPRVMVTLCVSSIREKSLVSALVLSLGLGVFWYFFSLPKNLLSKSSSGHSWAHPGEACGNLSPARSWLWTPEKQGRAALILQSIKVFMRWTGLCRGRWKWLGCHCPLMESRWMQSCQAALLSLDLYICIYR